MDYVDLYLIHAPRPWQQMGADYGAGNAEGWRAMEEIHTAPGPRIGVLNFTVTDIESLLESSTITPQVSDHVFCGQHPTPQHRLLPGQRQPRRGLFPASDRLHPRQHRRTSDRRLVRQIRCDS